MNTKKLYISLLTFALLLSPLTPVFAQGMMGLNQNYTTSNIDQAATTKDETDGKAIWDKLQAKQTTCQNLSEDDFDLLGDYFISQMIGTNHAAMNARLTQMMGADGEKQMHITLGKNYSNCDANATLLPRYQNFLSLMPMMTGANYNYQNTSNTQPTNYQNNRWNNMMGQWGSTGFPIVGTITMLLIWTILILAIVAIVKYLRRGK